MTATPQNSLGTRGTLAGTAGPVTIYRLRELERQGLARLERLPFSIRILLESNESLPLEFAQPIDGDGPGGGGEGSPGAQGILWRGGHGRELSNGLKASSLSIGQDNRAENHAATHAVPHHSQRRWARHRVAAGDARDLSSGACPSARLSVRRVRGGDEWPAAAATGNRTTRRGTTVRAAGRDVRTANRLERWPFHWHLYV